ncbi:PAAR-like protein [Elizabethkingia anophelis]|uniref:PAAR-like protein n=1 Tax=Elizabethkingia anophelis TaxID=1117645 RepID=UPI00136E3AD7|nr:PAAR-like protein [Elizabethkingia anophelis]MYY27261.1 DUF4280 domain-containing protein [Elizabethkingia anophelis]
MPQIITENASLICDKGISPSILKVTNNSFYKIENKTIATELDKDSGINISTFGICSVTKIACCPAITKWENIAKNSSVNNYKILTDKSSCQCVVGGKISVLSKGHCENHEVE